MDLNELRKIAESPGVRPGPWHVYDRGIGYEVHDENDYELTGGMRETFDKDDAEFIATFDPPTILALLSRLEQAEHGTRAAKSELQEVVNEAIRQKKRAINAEQQVARVREMHRIDEYNECSHCMNGHDEGILYPCDTIRALDGDGRE